LLAFTTGLISELKTETALGGSLTTQVDESRIVQENAVCGQKAKGENRAAAEGWCPPFSQQLAASPSERVPPHLCVLKKNFQGLVRLGDNAAAL
jgi:hypothetical protein